MNKGVLITVLIVAAIAIVVGFVSFGDRSDDLNSGGGTPRIDNTKTNVPPVDDSSDDFDIEQNYEVIIEMSSSGFSPSTLTINVGDSAKFTTVGSGSYWPASAIHPTHTVYPGSDINKCNSAEKDTIFDACKGISLGGSYTFTFNEAGTWRYHDHRRSNRVGTIIVN